MVADRSNADGSPLTCGRVESNCLCAFQESRSIYQPVYCGLRDDIPQQERTVRQIKYKG